MNGKILVFIIVFGSLILGSGLFFVLRESASNRHMIADQIKTEFISYATEVKETQKLQVAQLNQVEVFERTSKLNVLWDQVKLPDVVVSITTPVHYVYAVDMKGPWEFVIYGQILIVNAPKLEFNNPAPDISATKFEVKKGSIFRDGQAALRDLQNQITPLLSQRAEQNIPLIKETARKSIQDYVTTWMNSKFQQDQQKLEVQVHFPDDQPAPTIPESK